MTNQIKHLKIYTDGGSRGNPGPGAFGVVIKDEKDNILFKEGKKIGKCTNNQAEYQGLIAGLKWLIKNKPKVESIDFYLDSRLVVNQMQGNFYFIFLNLRPLWYQAKNLVKKIKPKLNYHHIPREKNFEADEQLNQALDK